MDGQCKIMIRMMYLKMPLCVFRFRKILYSRKSYEVILRSAVLNHSFCNDFIDGAVTRPCKFMRIFYSDMARVEKVMISSYESVSLYVSLNIKRC